jgi:CHAD domain-containing protein
MKHEKNIDDLSITGTIPTSKPLAHVEYLVTTEDPVTEAVSKIFTVIAHKIAVNAEGALNDTDPEFAHQLRVALRTAKTACCSFETAMTPACFARLTRSLTYAGRCIGKVRDMDVMEPRIARRCERADTLPEIRDYLLGYIRTRHDASVEAMNTYLRSPRYAALQNSLRHITFVRNYTRKGLPTIEAMAAALISKAIKEIKKHLKRLLQNPDDKQVHDLRIAFKCLRYTGDFFAELYNPKFGRRVKELIRLQDLLGEYTDAAMAHDFLRTIADTYQGGLIAGHNLLVEIGGLLYIERTAKERCNNRICEELPDLTDNLKALQKCL